MSDLQSASKTKKKTEIALEKADKSRKHPAADNACRCPD
jgi:hypothetical protein